MKFLDENGLMRLWAEVKQLLSGKLDVNGDGACLTVGTQEAAPRLSDLGPLAWLADAFTVKRYFLDLIHPVGDIVYRADDTDPGTLWGGTWTRWGQGRVAVGVDEDDGDFDAAEKTGGAKLADHEHTLTINSGGGGTTGGTAITVAQMPNHAHQITTFHGGVGNSGAIQRGYSGSTENQAIGTSATGGGAAHTHSTPNHTHTGTISSASLSALPPYITCYIWKRTA